MKILIRYSLSAMLSVAWLNSYSQSAKTIDVIQSRMDSARARLPIEKLYLHTDRSAYNTGDTLWFKVYLMNADYFTASKRSGLVYVELDDENGKSVKRAVVPMNFGLSWGSLWFDEKDVPEGNYILRAYTNWMRNFGNDYIFEKKITITAPGDETRLFNVNFTSRPEGDKRKVEAKLALSTLDKTPLMLKDMQLKVHDDKRTLFNGKMTTGFDGSLGFNFTLPKSAVIKDLKVVATDIGKDVSPLSATIPILLYDAEKADLQFMPEGGVLTAGTLTKVGFKAIAESGRAMDIHGKIVDNEGKEVTRFTTLHKGMGSFEITPEKGQLYTAEIPLTEGKVRKIPLPQVKDTGSSLRIEDIGDSLRVVVSSYGIAGVHYLIGQSRGVACYIERADLSGGRLTRTVAKTAFPTGIARFTLMNATQQPVNERIVFINHHDNLQISFNTDKNAYRTADSIAVKISVKDKNGKPVQGSFSASVTDNSQTSPDTLDDDLANHLLLTSDLKGMVEEPGYYFKNEETSTLAALDNLLLTQGWVGYKWDEVLRETQKTGFAAEPVFAVQGRVVNYANKPVAGSPLVIISKNPYAILEATTDANGRFRFDGLLPIDTASYMIQAKNKRGKNAGIDIEIDRFNAPEFAPLKETFLPWYVNADANLVSTVSTTLARQDAVDVANNDGRLLKEVQISSKRISRASNALGLGNPDLVLDDADLQERDGRSLLQILQKDVEGFGEFTMVSSVRGRGITSAFTTLGIKRIPLRVLIDGINININYVPVQGPRGYVDFLISELSRIKAADVTGVEVFSRMGGGTVYVTTRAGIGPYLEKIPGAAVYRPMAVNTYKQFYRPRYTAKTDAVKYDMRTTIHWEPSIVTDKDGNALLSFYAAGKPATYTVKIEGTNMNGLLGVNAGEIKVSGGTAP